MGVETDNPFEKVLDRLREKGWTKKQFGESEGPNCIRGAAGYSGLSVWTDVIGPLRPIVQAEYKDRLGDTEIIAGFNDHPDTTFSDVERVLEKAAVKWEEERVLRDD